MCKNPLARILRIQFLLGWGETRWRVELDYEENYKDEIIYR